MTKPYVTVSLILHGGTTKEIADYVDNDGKFIALGTQAMAMLERHEAIHYVDANGVETIIPYHAIVEVNVAKESDDYTEPEDAYCQPIECEYGKVCANDEPEPTPDPEP